MFENAPFSIEQLFEIGKNFDTPGWAYVPLILLLVFLVRQIISLKRYYHQMNRETMEDLITLVQQVESLKESGASRKTVEKIKQRILPSNNGFSKKPSSSWFVELFNWQNATIALLGALTATFIKVTVISTTLYLDHVSAEVEEGKGCLRGTTGNSGLICTPWDLYADLTIWIQAMAVAVLSAIVSLLILRGSEGNRTTYFIGGLFVNFLLPPFFFALEQLKPGLMRG